MKSKVCVMCNEEKQVSEFWKQKGRLDGLQRGCKKCDAIRSSIRGRTISGRLKYTQTKARLNHVPFNLTIDYYTNLINKPCIYCSGNLNETGTGLDRLKNETGYTKGNVVPCCWTCNMVKGDNFTFSEMKLLGKTIKKIKKSRLN